MSRPFAPTKCLILAKTATQNGLSELQYAVRDSVPNRAEIGRLSPVLGSLGRVNARLFHSCSEPASFSKRIRL